MINRNGDHARSASIGNSTEDARAMPLVLSLQNIQDIFPYLARLLAGINTLPNASLFIVIDYRGCLVVIYSESFLKRIGIVVASLNERLAGNIILQWLFRGVEGCMIRATGSRMDQAACDTSNKKRIVYL